MEVVLLMVGGDDVVRNFKVAVPDGRIVNPAYLKALWIEVDMLP